MVQGFTYDPREVAMSELFPSESSKQSDISAELSKLPPLNLTLRKTPSFLNLLKTKLSKNESSANQRAPEKLKASNFPASLLRIGSWQEASMNESDLVAKCYYSKRKLVWEVLRDGLKSKIEIQWSDISAIRATRREDHPGILEIELGQAPTFYREANPQPRKHTIWHMTTDFTDGQASLHRRHYIKFPPGILDRQYEKLLQCDQRLMELSRKGFPSHDSPYFDWCPYEHHLNYSFDPPAHEVKPQIHFRLIDPRESLLVDPIHQLFQTNQRAIDPAFHFEDSTASPISDDHVSNFGFGDSGTTHWAHGMNDFANDQTSYHATTSMETPAVDMGVPSTFQQNLFDDPLHYPYDMGGYLGMESSLNHVRPFQDTSYANSGFTMGSTGQFHAMSGAQTCPQVANSSLPSHFSNANLSMHQYGNVDYMYPPFSHGF
ncbi:uncharacterized protein LOC116213162 isoform X2 [Punica granatum]|uniref:Uncharacterized protein LOC116213162 isoform X2 n=1 Tax=Punica granatum TaxID=22663 RepID=A0A6P8E9A5_PUNGR|nr:uncharacterized protein LOC116213162 isoform X2 [Punica granatum]